MRSKVVASGVLFIAFSVCGVAAADEQWNDKGRLIDSESYDRTAKGFYFTLYPGEDPVESVRRCAIAMREMGHLASVSCFAYTSKQRFDTVDRLPRMCPTR